MNIPPILTNAYSKLKAMGPLGSAAKSVGLVGIGTTLYDSNYLGKLYAKQHKKEANAKAGLEYFNNTQYLDNKSHLISKIKNKLFKWELENTIRGDAAASSGYTSGFFSGLGRAIVPLSLSVATLCLKGKAAWATAGSLLLYALTSVGRHATSHLNDEL